MNNRMSLGLASVTILVGGVLNTGLGALSGALGSLSVGEPVKEATIMGAVGGAVVGVGGSAVSIALMRCGLFKSESKGGCIAGLLGYTSNMLSVGLIGYAIMKKIDPAIVISLMGSVSSFGVGGLITFLPAVCAATCILLPQILEHLKNQGSDLDTEAMDARYRALLSDETEAISSGAYQSNARPNGM